MKFILSFFISAIITFSTFAQYLSPCKSFYATRSYKLDKGSGFGNLLLGGLGDTFEFRYVETPIFTPTILLQIQAKSDGTYKAVVRTSSRSEYTVNRNRGKALYEYTASVDSFDAKLLSSVFDGVIDKTHYPVEINIGVDGSTYHFISRFGVRSAIIWSPDSGDLKTIIRILNLYIERIKKSRKHVSLTASERKTLEEILTASRYTPGIEDYEWLLSFQKSIQKNKDKYFGSLSLEERENVIELLIQMDAEIRRLFAFGDINNKEELHSIVSTKQMTLLLLIRHFRKINKDNPEYIEFENDNLFRSLIKEFKLEDK